jgi:UPF0716 protein FxsA
MQMFWLIVGVIILLPVIELYGLLTVGRWIGVWPTLFLVIATSMLGAYLARREGLRAYRQCMLQLRRGEPPAQALLDGICILVGALFLFIPGFFTDFVGILLLLPYTRAIVKRLLRRWIEKKIRSG